MICKGFGGAERAFVDTSIGLQKRGHTVLAVIDKHSKSQEQLEKNLVSHEIIPLLFRQNPFAKLKLKKLLLNFKPDIVHIHLRRSMGFAGKASQSLSFPVVASVHNYNSIKTYAYADKIISLTEEHKKFIVDSFPETNSKIEVIQNFSRLGSKRHIISDHKPIRYLAFGRFVHKKGFDLLIQAFAKLLSYQNNITLNIVGDGDQKNLLSSLIQKHHCEEKIHLLPWANNITELLDQHDVFVLPSRLEPFGIAVLEAMARGKLIISTKSEGPRQFLNKDTALLCETDDVDSLHEQLLISCKNIAELQPIADKANEHFRQNFSEQVVIPKIEMCYESLLNIMK